MQLRFALAAIAVADLDRLVHRHNKDFPVADMAFGTRAGNFFQAFDRAIDKVVVDRDLKGDLSQQVRLILVPSIRFELTALASVAHSIANGHPRHVEPPQGLLTASSFVGWITAKIIFMAVAPEYRRGRECEFRAYLLSLSVIRYPLQCSLANHRRRTYEADTRCR